MTGMNGSHPSSSGIPYGITRVNFEEEVAGSGVRAQECLEVEGCCDRVLWIHPQVVMW